VEEVEVEVDFEYHDDGCYASRLTLLVVPYLNLLELLV